MNEKAQRRKEATVEEAERESCIELTKSKLTRSSPPSERDKSTLSARLGQRGPASSMT